MDVKAYLFFFHSNFEEEIYMKQLEGFYWEWKSTVNLQIEEESLWLEVGLKVVVGQEFFTFFHYKLWFWESNSKSLCLLQVVYSGDNFLMLLQYVDNIIIGGKSTKLIYKLKKDLPSVFDMKDLGAVR